MALQVFTRGVDCCWFDRDSGSHLSTRLYIDVTLLVFEISPDMSHYHSGDSHGGDGAGNGSYPRLHLRQSRDFVMYCWVEWYLQILTTWCFERSSLNEGGLAAAGNVRKEEE